MSMHNHIYAHACAHVHTHTRARAYTCIFMQASTYARTFTLIEIYTPYINC
jgi:hypothetical protein